MSSVNVVLDLPEDWDEFKLPAALNARLAALLDQQDHNGELSESERHEAEALCDLVDMLSLLRLRSERAARSSQT